MIQVCVVLQVQFAIVYNPILNQLWTAKKGLGAEYNGAKVVDDNF